MTSERHHTASATFSVSLKGKVAVVTGGGGAICGEIARAYAAAGAAVAVWDIRSDAAKATADQIVDSGGMAVPVTCDVTDRASIELATQTSLSELGAIGILVNGAGGGRKDSTTSSELEFFDIHPDALMSSIALNYLSVVFVSQVVGRVIAAKKQGAILNIASIAGGVPLSRAVAYSNAKAAVINFTQWLAVHMAHTYSPAIRVNAIAPGFVLTDQNRFLLVDPATGGITERGEKIIAGVPAGRYGTPCEIVGAALWLVSDSASFVTGAVVNVDGGYSAYSGV